MRDELERLLESTIPETPEEKDKFITDLKECISKLMEESKKLEKQNDTSDTRITELEEEKLNLQSQFEEVTQDLKKIKAETTAELDKLKDENSELSVEVDTLKENYSTLTEDYRQHLIDQVVHNRLSIMSVSGSSDEVSKIATQIRDKFAKDTIESLKARLEEHRVVVDNIEFKLNVEKDEISDDFPSDPSINDETEEDAEETKDPKFWDLEKDIGIQNEQSK